MAHRRGLGIGKGRGYKNIIGQDPRVHSDSARGKKQPQNIKVPYVRSLIYGIEETFKNYEKTDEFQKLSEKDKALFRKVTEPSFRQAVKALITSKTPEAKTIKRASKSAGVLTGLTVVEKASLLPALTFASYWAALPVLGYGLGVSFKGLAEQEKKYAEIYREVTKKHPSLPEHARMTLASRMLVYKVLKIAKPKVKK